MLTPIIAITITEMTIPRIPKKRLPRIQPHIAPAIPPATVTASSSARYQSARRAAMLQSMARVCRELPQSLTLAKPRRRMMACVSHTHTAAR